MRNGKKVIDKKVLSIFISILILNIASFLLNRFQIVEFKILAPTTTIFLSALLIYLTFYLSSCHKNNKQLKILSYIILIYGVLLVSLFLLFPIHKWLFTFGILVAIFFLLYIYFLLQGIKGIDVDNH